MAYGDIHNETGTVCKAKSDATCPFGGGHSSSEDEYIEHVSAVEGIDANKVRALIADGTPRQDAVAVVKESLDTSSSVSKIGFLKPQRNAAIGKYEMSDERFNLQDSHPGDRYYDSDGGAYIVETSQKGQFATLNQIASDGTVPRNTTGSDGELRVDSTQEGNFLRKLNPPKDSKYVDGKPGYSESKAIKDLPSGGSWPRSVSAVLNYRDENRDQKSVELVAPVGRLTDKKRIEIGKQLWSFTGKDPQMFEDAGEKQQLNWINQRIMRRENYSWKTDDDGSVSYSHSMGSGSSHKDKQIKLLEI